MRLPYGTENATVVRVSKEDKEEREGADEKSDLILQKILLDLVSETVIRIWE